MQSLRRRGRPVAVNVTTVLAGFGPVIPGQESFSLSYRFSPQFSLYEVKGKKNLGAASTTAVIRNSQGEKYDDTNQNSAWIHSTADGHDGFGSDRTASDGDSAVLVRCRKPQSTCPALHHRTQP